MNAILEQINSIGKAFVEFAFPVLVQSSVLIVILLLVDLVLRKRVRAVFRYCIWMLVLVKLVLPSSLSSPFSFGYLFGDRLGDVTVSGTTTTAEPVEMPLPMEMAGEGEARSVEAISMAPIVTSRAEDIEPVVSMVQVTWQGIVFLVWLAVVGAMALLLLQRALFVRGLVAQAKNANSLMNDAFRYCCGQIGMKSEVGLKVSANATSPAVCGLFRPVILVPQNLGPSLGPSLGSSGLRTVLLHELAHIKRRDLWVNLVQTILQIIYFYNPLLWLANAVIRKIREQAVDETVQVAMGEKAQQYPETLVNVAKLAFKRPALSLRLIGVVESKSALKGRIKHILDRPIPKKAKLGLLGLAAVLIIGAVLLPMAAAENRGQKIDDRVEKQFVAKLPNGVMVELVGVCDWPHAGRRCWRPDGSELEEEIYATKWNKKSPNPGEYGFMVKVDGPVDLNFRWMKIEGAGSREGSCNVVDSQGNQLKDFKAAISNMEEGKSATNVRIGVAVGPWKTIAEHNGKRMATKRSPDGNVLFSQAFETDDGVSIVLSDIWRKDSAERIVVIDPAGNIITSRSIGSVASGEIDQFTAKFYGLKLKDIDKFVYQFRPYECVEFKNVSLRPGVKTDVGVVVEKPGAKWFVELLKKAVTVNVDHSPDNDRLSVQYAVIAVCEAAGVPYKWEKSARLADPERRRFIEPMRVKRVTGAKALEDILKPVGLRYGLDDDGLYIYRSTDSQKLEEKTATEKKGKDRKGEITARLRALDEQRDRVQRDLDYAERALQDVRVASGFTDLEERSYRHPITERLMRLEQERDNCHLEIAQLRANIANLLKQPDSPEGKEKLKKVKDNLAVLEGKLEALDKMVQEAAARKRDFDRARVQYKRRARIRDERQVMLDSLKGQIEKMRIMYDEAERTNVDVETERR